METWILIIVGSMSNGQLADATIDSEWIALSECQRHLTWISEHPPEGQWLATCSRVDGTYRTTKVRGHR